MEIIQDFFGAFNELTKQDWRDILIMLGVASLLSFIIGWLLRSFKVRSLKRLLTDKENAYNGLNSDYKNNLSLLSAKEDEYSSLNDKVTSLNEELKGLRLKLANKELTPAIASNMDLEDERVEVELDENDTTKLSWLDKIKGAFSSKTTVNGVDVEEDLSISLEEKLEATNSMVDRLLTSNEKLEDENSDLKNKIIDLENKPVDAKPVVQEPVQQIVVNQSEAAKYTKSLTEARITGDDLLKRIQTLEIYNGKVIKQLEAANKVKDGVELKLKNNGDFKFKYDEIAAQFEQSKIENNKLVADLQKVSSTAKQNTFEVELKSKSALLDQCTKERTLLENKLKALTETIKETKPITSSKPVAGIATPKKEQEEKNFKFAEQRTNVKGLQTNKESEAKKALTDKLEAEKKAAELKVKQEEAERKAAAERKEEATKKALADKLEAEKKAAGLKAKQEEEKRQADLKAKQEATKREDELKLKQETATQKAAELKTTTEKITKPEPVGADLSHDIITRIKSKASNIDFGRIGTGNPAQKDDLKKIKGIGEFVEKKLNALGVYHFKQVANFDAKDIEKVNDAIEFFPGRIKRDNWVGQAKMIVNNNR